jgi:alpha-L-rhamnosidase
MLSKWTLLSLLAIPLLPAQESPMAGAPSGLRCEYLADPVGIDVPQPRLSWVLEHSARGERQTAYQVLVSLKPEAAAGDQWDSGKVPSGQSVHVVYAGKLLTSGQSYYWKVRYWDSGDRPSPYSAAARFETGLFESAEWKGKWIAGANQIRKEFTLRARPVRARAYVAGLGYYELRINGHKVGDRVLDPAWTTYDKRVLYTVYDITDRLRPGDNAVGVMLGEGWFKSRALRMQAAKRWMSPLTKRGKPCPARSNPIASMTARSTMHGGRRPAGNALVLTTRFGKPPVSSTDPRACCPRR